VRRTVAAVGSLRIHPRRESQQRHLEPSVAVVPTHLDVVQRHSEPVVVESLAPLEAVV
jgi:hypothetical protein